MMAANRRYALITGASTGIGRASAERLAADGFHVFATVRRPADAKRLVDAAGGRIIPLLMDVADSADIARAAAEVTANIGENGLDLLVNNAGIGVFQPLELIPLERFRNQLEVNVTGQLAVTQAFLPALRAAAGRIVIMGSIADRITMPFAGPQATAKRAMLGMAEALRQELAPWDIAVTVVEPASIRSAAIDKLHRDVQVAQEEFGPVGRALYGTAFQRMMARARVQVERGSQPEVVADVVSRVARAPRPKARYLVGKHSARLAVLAALPPGLLDWLRRRIFNLPAPGSRRTAASTPTSTPSP